MHCRSFPLDAVIDQCCITFNSQKFNRKPNIVAKQINVLESFCKNIRLLKANISFWATVCKTVRPMLSVRCLSVCPVCDVRALWPNGWTDQDDTWHAGRPWPWPHCVRWGPSSPPLKGLVSDIAIFVLKRDVKLQLTNKPPLKGHSPQFSAHICCGQMAAWIKMLLDMELGLSQGDSVLPPQIFGPCLLWPNGWMHQDATWYGGRPQPRRLC